MTRACRDCGEAITVPRRRWQPKSRREPLNTAVRVYLETGDKWGGGDEDTVGGIFLRFLPSDMRDGLWSEFGDQVLEEWIEAEPGTRPWAWWKWTAPGPRRVIRDDHLLATINGPGAWGWRWREYYGRPALRQVRPVGYVGLPLVESEASFLDRNGFLTADERARLTPADFEPEPVDQFLVDEADPVAMKAMRFSIGTGRGLED